MQRRVALATSLVTLLVCANARADGPPSPNAAMQNDVSAYYGGEKQQAYIFVSVGAASIAGGGILLSRDGDFARGLGWSLISLGALQAIGASFYAFQVGGELTHYSASLARDPAAFKKEEAEHIHGTTSRFVIYRTSELVLAAAGAGVATYGFLAKKDLWKGAGIGVAGEALTFFILDSFGTQAAHDYEDKVKRFEPTASVQVGGSDRPWGVTIGGKF